MKLLLLLQHKNYLNPWAIILTPCFPASYYFGPLDVDGKTPGDNSTSNFYRSEDLALDVAIKRGFEVK